MKHIASQQPAWTRLESLAARLNYDEAQTRLGVMNTMIAKGAPVNVSDLRQEKALLHIDVEQVLAQLVTKKVIVQNKEGQITFSYPVSALPTCHRVTLADGRSFHAMCAVDALGASFTFRQDIRVDSRCSHCLEPVRIGISNGKIVELAPAETHVLHIDLNLYDNWAATC